MHCAHRQGSKKPGQSGKRSSDDRKCAHAEAAKRHRDRKRVEELSAAGVPIPDGLVASPVQKRGRKRKPLRRLKPNSRYVRQMRDAAKALLQFGEPPEEEPLDAAQEATQLQEEQKADAARKLAAARLLKLSRQLDSRNASDGKAADGKKNLLHGAHSQEEEVAYPIDPQVLRKGETECKICLDILEFPNPEVRGYGGRRLPCDGTWGYARCCGSYFHFECVTRWISAFKNSPTCPYVGHLASRGVKKMDGGCPMRCAGAFDADTNPDGVKWNGKDNRLLVMGKRACDVYA